MPQFHYRARDELGRMVKGIHPAGGEDQLARTLREKKLYLISASEKGEKKKEAISFGLRKVGRSDLIEFSSHMATILSAGIPLMEGLQDMILRRKGTKFGKILQAIKDDVEGGSTLYEALAHHQQAFGEVYVYMVRAGETSGTVERVFEKLAEFLAWQEQLISEAKKLTLYPLVVLGAISILVIFVFAFAFPKISAVLMDMKVPLPASTRFLIGFSQLVQSSWHFLGLGIVAGGVGFRLISRTPGGRLMLDRLKLKLPVVGELIRKIALSRFAHHLGLLLEGGIGISDALLTVERVVGNRVISETIREVREEIQRGSTFTAALQRSGEFPPMALRMIAIGESTGTLTEALAKVSQYYDQEVPASVKKILTAAEPILIMFLAVMILGIALSIYLPIYKSIGMIGK